MTVAGQGSLSQSSITFDASNWNVAQAVAVTGLDDHVVNGNQTYQITGTTTSADANYNGMSMTPVTVTNTEADVAGFTVTPTSVQTSKAGATAQFNVALTSAPASSVTINLSSTNPAEGSLSSSLLTFNSTNWNVTQSVTVTGLNDGMANGNQTYQISGTAASADANYNGLSMTPVTVTNVDTNSAGFIVTPTSLTTSESGSSATFSIALATLPALPVTVNLTNGNPTQGALSQSSLTFTLLDWNVAQTVTVTGLDDHMVNGNQTYQITGSGSSADLLYNGLTITPITVVNQEADRAGFTVTPTSLTTSETGTSASFNVSLTSQPAAAVTVQLATSVAGQGSLSQTSLTFNSANWNLAQSVNVTGLDDHIVHGDQTYQVTGTAASADSNYNTITMTPVTVTNTEGDVAGINVTPTALTTSETGTSASFNVSLTSQPVAAVTIRLGTSVAGQGSLSQSSLTFNSTNWNVAQSVTVTGLDDHVVNGNQTYQVNGTASSPDANYNLITMAPVTVTNTEADMAGINVTPIAGLVTIAGGSASFTIVLTSQPSNTVSVPLSSSNPVAGNASVSAISFTSADWSAPQTVIVTSPNAAFASDVTFSISVGPAASSDLTYNAQSGGNVSITRQSLSLPPTSAPALPAVTAPPTASLFLVAATNRSTAASSVANDAAGGAGTQASANNHALAFGGLSPHAPSGIEAVGGAMPVLVSQTAAVSNRIVHVDAVIPRASWQNAQNESEMVVSEDVSLSVLPSRSMLSAIAPTPAESAQPDDILDVLNDDGERTSWTEPGIETMALIGTGILASSGYVLFNSRLGLWLLGLLTARPLWKQFDPQDVLYAWENGDRYQATDADDEETLMSLVD